MRPPRIPLLLNPRAGSLMRSGLNEWLHMHQGDFRFIETESAQDLTVQAKRLADKGEAVIAAAGGDGTLMCAMQGIIGSNSALGILPCGTMNVFARELGIGSRRFDVALEAMRSEVEEEVDIFAINGKPFLQMAGLGMDARVVQLVSPQIKKQLGPLAYVVKALQAAMEHHPLMHIVLPSGETVRANEVVFGNGKRYGGEAFLFAGADYKDGLLDMVAIEQESMGVLFEMLGAMLQNGASERTADFSVLRQITSCEIYSDEKAIPIQLDGDYVGNLEVGERGRIELLPQQLKVCVHPNPPVSNPVKRALNNPHLRKLLAAIKKDWKA